MNVNINKKCEINKIKLRPLNDWLEVYDIYSNLYSVTESLCVYCVCFSLCCMYICLFVWDVCILSSTTGTRVVYFPTVNNMFYVLRFHHRITFTPQFQNNLVKLIKYYFFINPSTISCFNFNDIT